MKKTIIITISVVMLIACSKKTDKKTIVKIGKTKVTETQFEQYLVINKRSKASPQLRKQMLNDYINKELLAQTAIKQGFLKKTEIQAELQRQKRELLYQRYIDHVLQKIPEKKLKKIYQKNPSSWQETQIHLAELHVKPGKDAKKKAMDLYQSPPKQGFKDLGWINKQIAKRRYRQDFENVSTGQTLPPKQTAKGWQILKIVNPSRSHTKPFEDIKYQLREQQRSALIKQLIQKSRAKINVTRP